MGFRELKALWSRKYPEHTPTRFKDLDAFDKMLDQEFYDVLSYPFEQEEEGDRHIPLRERRPLVQVSLGEIITNQQTALLFGEQHRPHIRCYDPQHDGSANEDGQSPSIQATQSAVDAIMQQFHIDELMIEAVQKGQSGSAAIISYILPDSSVWNDTLRGKYAVPTFDIRDPRKLIRLTQEYPLRGRELHDLGYSPESYRDDDIYWMKIVTDQTNITWYVPLKNEDYQKLGQSSSVDPSRRISWVIDEARTYAHGFRRVPAVWIRNLNERRKIDGRCTIQSIADIQVALDYSASQITRGFHYTADPLLAIERGEMDEYAPAGGSPILDDAEGLAEDMGITSVRATRSPARTLTIPHGSKAQMLEIAGTGLAAARDWFKTLREVALEVLSGNKGDQDKTSGSPHSGVALQVLNQPLFWLIERQRMAYGTHGLLPLVRLFLEAFVEGRIKLDGIDRSGVDSSIQMDIVWPKWMVPQGQELLTTLQALQLAAGGSVKEPRQIAPLDLVVRQTMMALGQADPTSAIAQAMKESSQRDAELTQKALDLKETAPPKPTVTAK